jgi:hypothetical protein
MSKETEIEETILITRSPEAIWDYIGDARNDPYWCARVVSVEQVSGDCPGPDARYRVIHRSARLKTPNELGVTVEEFDHRPGCDCPRRTTMPSSTSRMSCSLSGEERD